MPPLLLSNAAYAECEFLTRAAGSGGDRALYRGRSAPPTLADLPPSPVCVFRSTNDILSERSAPSPVGLDYLSQPRNLVVADRQS